MGVTVRQKKKGKGEAWWIFVNHNGKRLSRKVGNKAAADLVAHKIRLKLEIGDINIFNDTESVLFKKYAQKWIEVDVPATCKISTTEDYETILNNHILPVFGDMTLHQINIGQLKDFFYIQVNKGYAASTISHMKAVLSRVFNKAMDDGVISFNPTKNLGDRFMKQIKDAIEARLVADGQESVKPDPLTKEDLKLLIDTAKKEYPDYYPLFLILARTGLRLGEALGLRWQDINFQERFINLNRSYSRDNLTTLKNKKSRQVDMSPQLTETLLLLKKQTEYPKETDYVFTNKKGNLLDKNNWRKRIFYKALEKAKLRRIRPHDLRHTYATLRIQKGDNLADVSRQLGHHSVAFTEKVYYHYIPGLRRFEVDALDD